MYAVFKAGGRQYRATTGDKFNIEKIEGDVGSTLTFDSVLALGEGAALKVGAPTIAGAKVTAEIVAQGRLAKIIVFKYKRTRNYKRKKGHRQHFTRIRVTSIG